MMRKWNVVALLSLAVLAGGCSDLGGRAALYRAERMVWDARREESRLRLVKGGPDSTAELHIRAAYGRLRKTFHPPFVSGTGESTNRVRREVAREVGMAELTGALHAMRAGRHDLALESARWVESIADADTGLLRESGFTEVRALRFMRRYDEAITKLRGMLARFRPVAANDLGQEDQMLLVPDMVIELSAATGDSARVRHERDWAIVYYRGLLAQAPPVLSAQVRARLIRTLLEQGNALAARNETTELRRLVATTPKLKSLEPEVLYSEGRVLSMGADPEAALDTYDLVVMNYPKTLFGAKALFDGAILCERLKNRQGALARYRAILNMPKPVPELTSLASFRTAMVLEQLGNWVEARSMLESIPVRYPQSRAALEAPFAVVEHYARAGDRQAMRAELLQAIETYRGLIAQDTSSIYSTAYRSNIFRAYAALERWNDALATVDEMVRRDAGVPVVAQMLFDGARIATAQKNEPRAQAYLQRLVTEYPRSAWAGPVRELLRQRSAVNKR